MCERFFVAVVATFVVTVCFCCTFFFVVPLVSTRHTDALARDDTERVHKFDPTEAHGGKIRSPKRSKNSPPPFARSLARSPLGVHRPHPGKISSLPSDRARSHLQRQVARLLGDALSPLLSLYLSRSLSRVYEFCLHTNTRTLTLTQEQVWENHGESWENNCPLKMLSGSHGNRVRPERRGNGAGTTRCVRHAYSVTNRSPHSLAVERVRRKSVDCAREVLLCDGLNIRWKKMRSNGI